MNAYFQPYNTKCIYIDITVNFSHPVCIMKEDYGLIQPGIIFSNPSSFDITMQVRSIGINATAG